MTIFREPTKYALLLAGILLAACAARDPQESPFASKSAEEIYREAESNLANGDPDEAGDTFAEIERLYPYSEWSKRAVMMSAFAYHSAGKYDESRAAAQRYLDFYPADEDAAYAQYLVALSHYDQITDVGRDQGRTFEALQALRATIERYPDSEYATAARLKFDLALDHLAGQEMEIGRFYLKQGQYQAAIKRFRAVVEEYQVTGHTPEALHRLVESYLSLGLNQEAQTAGAILGFNYQGTQWYQDSFALLTGEGLEIRESGQNWLTAIYRQVVQGKWL